jgi:hypothetical protein
VLRWLTWLKTVWTWRVLFRDRLRHVQAAAELVADELESNARKIGRPTYRTDFLVSQIDIRRDAWKEYAATLHAISRPYPELWDELRSAYAQLEGPSERYLPSADSLEDLAGRLRATMRATRP